MTQTEWEPITEEQITKKLGMNSPNNNVVHKDEQQKRYIYLKKNEVKVINAILRHKRDKWPKIGGSAEIIALIVYERNDPSKQILVQRALMGLWKK